MRRFSELQEIRHSNHVPLTPKQGSSSEDKMQEPLRKLNDLLYTITTGVESVNESLEPLLRSLKTPTQAIEHEEEGGNALLRQHAELVADWKRLHFEAEKLKSELSDDTFLVQFRTSAEQVRVLFQVFMIRLLKIFR